MIEKLIVHRANKLKASPVDHLKVKWRFRFLMAILVGVAALLGCERGIFSPAPGPVYFNSFEADSDTAGWRGYGTIKFVNDAPSGGGKQSLYVSGGCIVPHASFVLPAFRNDGHFVIQCWGKNLAIGGGVTLNIAGDVHKPGIGLPITDPDWTFHQSADTLFCPASHNLELTLGAGGIAPSAMLVDLIEIIKVK